MRLSVLHCKMFVRCEQFVLDLNAVSGVSSIQPAAVYKVRTFLL